MQLTNFVTTTSKSAIHFSMIANFGATSWERGSIFERSEISLLELEVRFRNVRAAKGAYSKSVRVSTRFVAALRPSRSTRSCQVWVME